MQQNRREQAIANCIMMIDARLRYNRALKEYILELNEYQILEYMHSSGIVLSTKALELGECKVDCLRFMHVEFVQSIDEDLQTLIEFRKYFSNMHFGEQYVLEALLHIQIQTTLEEENQLKETTLHNRIEATKKAKARREGKKYIPTQYDNRPEVQNELPLLRKLKEVLLDIIADTMVRGFLSKVEIKETDNMHFIISFTRTYYNRIESQKQIKIKELKEKFEEFCAWLEVSKINKPEIMGDILIFLTLYKEYFDKLAGKNGNLGRKDIIDAYIFFYNASDGIANLVSALENEIQTIKQEIQEIQEKADVEYAKEKERLTALKLTEQEKELRLNEEKLKLAQYKKQLLEETENARQAKAREWKSLVEANRQEKYARQAKAISDAIVTKTSSAGELESTYKVPDELVAKNQDLLIKLFERETKEISYAEAVRIIERLGGRISCKAGSHQTIIFDGAVFNYITPYSYGCGTLAKGTLVKPHGTTVVLRGNSFKLFRSTIISVLSPECVAKLDASTNGPLVLPRKRAPGLTL